MSDQPEALRVADRLDLWGDQGDLLEAAAELRRLHAERDALRQIVADYPPIEAELREVSDRAFKAEAERDALYKTNVAATAVYDQWLTESKERGQKAEAERDALRAECDQAHNAGFVEASRIHGKEIEQLRAERDALRADAERYRWLRECARATSEHWGGRWSLVIEGPAPESNAMPAGIDTAIDAARALKEAK